MVMDQSKICPICKSSNLKYDVHRTWRVPSEMKPSHFSAHCEACGALLWRHHDLDNDLAPPGWISGNVGCGCASQ